MSDADDQMGGSPDPRFTKPTEPDDPKTKKEPGRTDDPGGEPKD